MTKTNLRINLASVKTSNGNKKSFNGQSLVEFALTLPLLLLLLFGALDMGRIFHAAVVLNNAAREGARHGSLNRNDVVGMQQAAVREAGLSGITISLIDVDVVCGNMLAAPPPCPRGEPINVTVTHEFDLILGWILPGSISLTGTAEMVVQ